MRSVRWSFCLVAVSAFCANPAYKIGDKVEALPFSSIWYPCTVASVQLIDQVLIGGYTVSCLLDDGSQKEWGIPPTPNHIRADTGDSLARIQRAQGATAAMNAKGPGGKYDARNPTTCASSKEPGQGAPSSAQARQYVLCALEGEQNDRVSLLENLKVEIGVGRPINSSYLASDRLPDADVTQPVYPIRGSYDRYICTQPASNANAGKNCTVSHHPDANGACWRTTFGDWRCSMAGSGNNSTMSYNVVPPK